jgi:hypothetical protein
MRDLQIHRPIILGQLLRLRWEDPFLRQGERTARGDHEADRRFRRRFHRNFRTFFDAKAINAACKHYAEREPLDPQKMAILEAMAETGGKAAYGFFSDENRLCEQMSGIFVERDEDAAYRRKPSDGTRDFILTRVGTEFLKARAKAREGGTP